MATETNAGFQMGHFEEIKTKYRGAKIFTVNFEWELK